MRHVAELGGPAGALAAEAPYTSASVNSLATYSATAPVATTGAASAAAIDPAELEAMMSSNSSASSSSSGSGSQFTPVRTWASMTSGQSGSGGAQAGNAADQGMADIVDAGDVFGNADDSDGG